MERKYDVFISHAGEDKDEIAEPIYNELRRRAIRTFLDRPELRVGGDAVQEMLYAMKTALIGLFILSPEFAAKDWPMRELFCFEERANQADGGGGLNGAMRPVMIPVFYRLTVAETRYRLAFKKYPEICVQHGFMDRLDKGEVVMSKVLDALASLSSRTGIECGEGSAVAAGASDGLERREKLVQRVCDEVERVWKEEFSSGNVVGAGASPAVSDVFQPTFHAPENPQEVLLDFSGAMGEGVPQSPEAEVLREVLRAGNEWESTKMITIKGDAGVGKSCILRSIARKAEVKRRFPGGVYFLTFGMDATVETLRSEMLNVVRVSGGHHLARKLKGEKSLDAVLEGISRWMKGRKCLMLLDDLWDHSQLSPKIVSSVAKVLSACSGSALAITTRFASGFAKGKVVQVERRDPMSEESKNILLRYAGLGVEDVMKHNAVRVICDELLKMCGGLPIRLAVVGRCMRELIANAGSAPLELLKRYIAMMRDGEKLEREDIDGCRSLWTMLNVALIVLEEQRGKYGRSDIGLSWQDMHRSFCVMKKQIVVNFGVLARVWGLKSDDEAMIVVKSFSDVGLADIVAGTGALTRGVRLHSLVHDYCLACATRKDEVSNWHDWILEAYMREEEGEQGLRPWWNVDEDGYIYDNVCRHLGISGRIEELIELVLSKRWLKARLEHGGLLAWVADLAECVRHMDASGKYEQDEKEELLKGLQLVRDAVLESWPFFRENPRECGFQVHARLSNRDEWAVRKFLESVQKWEKRPCAKALGRLWTRPGSRDKGGYLALDGQVNDIALDDEGRLVVAGVGRYVVLIDLEMMQVVRRCAGHTKIVQSAGFSSDGSRVFSWSRDGEPSSTCEGVVREWDRKTGSEISCVFLKKSGASPSRCATICPDWSFVVTGSIAGVVEVWDLRGGNLKGEAILSFAGAVECVSVSHDGRRIVAGGEDGTLHVWDERTRAQVGCVMRGHESWVTCAAFSADGGLVVSGSRDCTIRVWDVQSGTVLMDPICGHDDWILCVSFSWDGRRIVSGGVDRTVRVWDAATGAQVGRVLCGHTNWVRCVSVTRDGRFVISGGDDLSVRVWDLAGPSDDVQEGREEESEVSCLDMSFDGRKLATGFADGTVRIWNALTGKQEGDTLRAHEQGVSCVALSPRGGHLVSGQDSLLYVWDLEAGARVGEAFRGHTDSVTCAAYSPNGLFIATGSRDRTMRLWSTATHAQMGMPFGVSRVTIPPSPPASRGIVRKLAGCFRSGGNGDAEAFEDEVYSPVILMAGAVSCVSVSADGSRVVYGSRDGLLYAWDASSRRSLGYRRLFSQFSRREIKCIERVEMLGRDMVRSVDSGGVERRWIVDGLHEVTGDKASSAGWSEGNEVVCVGRDVVVRGSGAKLATLPASVKGQLWRYSESTGAVCAVLKNGRVVFLHVER